MEKYTYEIIGDEISKVVFRSDGACIPMDEANSDYQRYLKWLENPDAEEQVLIFPIITETPTEQTQEGAE
jgi:hypothetical protein